MTPRHMLYKCIEVGATIFAAVLTVPVIIIVGAIIVVGAIVYIPFHVFMVITQSAEKS